MPPGVTFTALSAGYEHSLALDATGHAWAWGANSNGELGIGSTTGPDNCGGYACSTKPVPVPLPKGVTFTAIAAGYDDSLALDTNGNAWAWGYNFYGQLGDGSTTGPDSCGGYACSTKPVAVIMPPGVTFSALATAGQSSLALDTNGDAWSWGYNGVGDLGNGTDKNTDAPGPVTMPPGGVTFTEIAAGVALDTRGNAWAWGGNQYGQVGDRMNNGPDQCSGINPCSKVPVAVYPSAATYTAIGTGGNNHLALDSNGNAWAWGYNYSGELGTGASGPDNCGTMMYPTGCSMKPVAVSMPSGVVFTAVAMSDFDHSVALDPNGQAWAWGYNSSGEIGNGTTNTIVTVPVRVSMPQSVNFTAVVANGPDSLAFDH
jgi:alpha-tubulin suppressor-like RCC1 family protein